MLNERVKGSGNPAFLLRRVSSVKTKKSGTITALHQLGGVIGSFDVTWDNDATNATSLHAVGDHDLVVIKKSFGKTFGRVELAGSVPERIHAIAAVRKDGDKHDFDCGLHTSHKSAVDAILNMHRLVTPNAHSLPVSSPQQGPRPTKRARVEEK
jgi:hypothetical protein